MPDKTKPQIVVTGPDQGGAIAWFFTALSIRLAGGHPIRITPNSFDNKLDYDAYVIGGGADIHPDNRQKEPVPQRSKRSLLTRVKEGLLYPMETLSRLSESSYDKPRDELEQKFIDYAVAHNKPLLGICRGHQLLNSRLGGTLYTSTLDLLNDNARIRTVLPRKTVFYAKKGTLIHDIAGDEPLPVNAIHSQAVAKTGHNLEQTGVEPAGITQVIEAKDGRPLLGVQWHPEYLFYLKQHRAIFKWLVNGGQL
ncbi:gamma-glutamyl-gamma-aminobutyrate hydrolase family protein [Thalassotalea marina]|uniref:Gamma-glutamyl-gamma-aminobutyrate hydrolase family protein n=1 Tax=Thalassotalea marina TaxID=1673741 RepID=A0A919BLX6_9GAMM|nr:gamma-glutamyl-gamma-aminobutyrate hydrolase family protein [Thalassotalea marina]GHF99456.1 hypothetical protein GCM10017161_29880 [Thalassotalea marina]